MGIQEILYLAGFFVVVAYIVWKLKGRAEGDGFFSRDTQDRKREK